MGDEQHAADEARYRVRVAGHVAPHWFGESGDLAVTWEEDGTTLLAGTMPDQAALHGLLGRLRDLGLTLLAAERVSG